MLFLLLISRIVLQYIKAILKPTTTDVELQRILMVNGKYQNNTNNFQFLYVEIIAHVYGNSTDIEEILWHKEKCSQNQFLVRLMV